MKPIICITCDRRNQGPTPKSTTKIRPARPEVFVKEALVYQVIQAGGVPFLIPPLSVSIQDVVEYILQISDGVIISGGAFDISPHHYGQSQKSRLDHIDENRTGLELQLASRCVEEQKPLLGICGGMQVMAVATGGSLVQDIGTEFPDALEHEQPTDPIEGWHDVLFSTGRLHDIYGSKIRVNSTHHQSVDHPGSFMITGNSPDGVAEAFEHPNQRCSIGVQWHPEFIDGKIFQYLIHCSL